MERYENTIWLSQKCNVYAQSRNIVCVNSAQSRNTECVNPALDDWKPSSHMKAAILKASFYLSIYLSIYLSTYLKMLKLYVLVDSNTKRKSMCSYVWLS